MIRKSIIVMLTLAAVGAGILYGVSFSRPLVWRDRDLADVPIVTTPAQARVPFCFECQIRDGRLSAGYLYVICGNPRNKQFKFAGVEFANLIEKWEKGGVVEKAVLIVPAWTLPILFITYPTIAFIRGPVRRHRRRRRGECIGCGYDLTGNQSGICPECGEAI